ncbi:MAG: hypothetical protein RI953_2313 [Pseudomonadota bacterium]|jgi:hypothetical protein
MKNPSLIISTLLFVGCKPVPTSAEVSTVIQPQVADDCCLERLFKVKSTVEPKHIRPSGEIWTSNNLTRNCSLFGKTQKVLANNVYSIVDQKVDLKFNDKGGTDHGSIVFRLNVANARNSGDKSEVSLYCSFRGVHSTYDLRRNANEQLKALFVSAK